MQGCSCDCCQMEDKSVTRSRSACRLAVQGNPGRVRWLIGNEKQWRYALKVLVGVPIILVCALVIAIALSHLATAERLQDSTAELSKSFIFLESRMDSKVALAQEFNLNEALDRGTKNEFQTEIRTTYTPPKDLPLKESFVGIKQTRRHRRKTRMHRGRGSMVKFWAAPYQQKREVVRRNVTTKSVNKHYVEHLTFDTLWKNKLNESEVRRVQAATMKSYMDFNVDPCDNFYDFTCGNWKAHNYIPPDRTEFDTFEILREGLDQAMRDVLADEEHMLDGINRTDARVKARDLYRSCMNQEILDKRGLSPLMELLVNLGRWPVIDDKWDESKFDFVWLMAQLKLFNNDILISEWVGPDIQNSNEYIIQIDQTNLGLPSREYYLDPANYRYLDSYRIFMINIVRILGANMERAISDVNDVIDFEIALAELVAIQSERRNLSEIYLRTTIEGLFYEVPQINWFQYFKIVLQKEVDPDEPVACFCVDYLEKFVALTSATPQRTIANYLLWRFVRHRINNLDQRFSVAKQRFYYVLFGREKAPPRWQECVTQVNANLGMAVGSLFVDKYFDESSRNDTMQMTKELQHAFKQMLSDLEWLDEETKSLAMEKIDKMCLKIGYPDFIVNKSLLSKRYGDVVTHPDHYFENMLSILRHLTRVEHSRLGTAVNKTLWNTAPAIVNAYYSRNRNQIMFPAGILQPPFYHKFFPPSLNYGGIGVVIGHEITHGFDDKGRLFDKDGNLHRWWHENAIHEFRSRAQCLIEQYNSYVHPQVEQNVDGEHTQGENIADNGGIKHAFKAYKNWMKKHPEQNDTLPGLNATGEQLFFINFAQIWCGAARPEAARNKLKTALHSPGRFRVIGSLSNSDDFAKLFNCPRGSPMNPTNKCRIW